MQVNSETPRLLNWADFASAVEFPFVIYFLSHFNAILQMCIVLQMQSHVNNLSARVLARPERQGAAPCRFVQRPVVLFSALSFFLSALSFFSALSFSESPLVSSGFYQRSFELEVAESVQLRRKVARCSCITLLFASDIADILDLRHRFRHESEATLMAFEGMSFLHLFTWKVVRGFMNINKIQWILTYAN